ncbi:MAG TPA: polysaccharide deacetylase family protein, partial [Cyclobacteriaceae bacterium]|nr:polysaccharide deacetylase family protein [Cyclobacteriaceae bacterium]
MIRNIAPLLILSIAPALYGQELPSPKEPALGYDQLKSRTIEKLKRLKPGKFGSFIPGIKTRIETQEKIIALTFDACGGPKGSGYDTLLIEYLVKEKIPATLFISGSWIEKNDSIFRLLSKEPLFEIENHGWEHHPCSITAKSKYGIPATGSVGNAYGEIALNARQIESYTHRKPQLYRPATAAADEGCVA